MSVVTLWRSKYFLSLKVNNIFTKCIEAQVDRWKYTYFQFDSKDQKKLRRKELRAASQQKQTFLSCERLKEELERFFKAIYKFTRSQNRGFTPKQIVSSETTEILRIINLRKIKTNKIFKKQFKNNFSVLQNRFF